MDHQKMVHYMLLACPTFITLSLYSSQMNIFKGMEFKRYTQTLGQIWQKACIAPPEMYSNAKHYFSCLFSVLFYLILVDRLAAVTDFFVAYRFKNSSRELLNINICKGCNFNVWWVFSLIFCNVLH